MQGTVTKFSTTKNGKATIYIDEKMYFVGRCNVDGLQVGDRISFEGKTFGSEGQFWGLDKWGKLPNGNGNVPLARVESRPVHTTPTGSLDEPTLRFISNCVGSAITAGTIKDPEQIEKWVSAARNALRGQS
jgi:hypothetical protein